MNHSIFLFGIALAFSSFAWGEVGVHAGATVSKAGPKHPVLVAKPETSGAKSSAWTMNQCADTAILHGNNGRVYFYARHGEAKATQDDLLFCFNGVNACLNSRQWQRGMANTSVNGQLNSAMSFDLYDGNYTMVTVTRKMPNGKFCFNTMRVTRHGDNYAVDAVANPAAALPQPAAPAAGTVSPVAGQGGVLSYQQIAQLRANAMAASGVFAHYGVPNSPSIPYGVFEGIGWAGGNFIPDTCHGPDWGASNNVIADAVASGPGGTYRVRFYSYDWAFR